MRCVKCKSEELYGEVIPHIMLPLMKKGGNVVTAGYSVTQKMVSEWWLNEDNKERLMLGPIVCGECTEEHTYFKKLSPALRAVSYADALKFGYNHFAAAPSTVGEPEAEEEEA